MSNPSNLHDCEDQDDIGPDPDVCDMCGGEGIIMLSEAGPGVWGEDCFCDEDRPITCPACRGKGTRK